MNNPQNMNQFVNQITIFYFIKMVEGGMEMHDMGHEDDDDYDEKDYDEYDDYDDIDFQNMLNKETTVLNDLSNEDKVSHEKEITRKMIKRFYSSNNETIHRKSGFYFKQDEHGRPMLYVEDRAGNEIPLTHYKSGKRDEVINFYKFSTLFQNYHIVFIRDVLYVDDYISPSAQIKKGRSEFQKMIGGIELDNTAIPLQDITSEQEGQKLLETASNAETHVKEIETSFILSKQVNQEIQTDVTKREMDGILKAMTNVKEEIANELTKLNETNKHIEKENRKLEQAKSTNDEYEIKKIKTRISELESERSARLEVININKDKLRNQINRIKQTIHKILNEDTTLAEKIKTLFREQGVTIASILTAFGLIIGVIVEAFTGTTSSPPPPPPKGKGGVKEWIKKQLSYLGKLLASLAGKAAAALPGIIGSIVSWLLSTTGSIIKWFANNLWVLLLFVIGLLFTSAKTYLNSSHK